MSVKARVANDHAVLAKPWGEKSESRLIADEEIAVNSGMSDYRSTDHAHAELANPCEVASVMLASEAEDIASNNGWSIMA